MGIFGSEGFGAFGHLSAFSDTLHEVAHGEVLFDVVHTVKLTPVVDGMGMFGNDAVSEGNVGSNDKITRFAEFDNTVVGFIRTLIDDNVLDVWGFADGDLFVGNDFCQQGESFYASEYDGFEQVGKGIAVDVECHRTISLTRPTSPLMRRTLMPWGWVGELVRIFCTLP